MKHTQADKEATAAEEAAEQRFLNKQANKDEKENEEEPRILISSTGPYFDELPEEEQKEYRKIMGWPEK